MKYWIELPTVTHHQMNLHPTQRGQRKLVWAPLDRICDIIQPKESYREGDDTGHEFLYVWWGGADQGEEAGVWVDLSGVKSLRVAAMEEAPPLHPSAKGGKARRQRVRSG